MDLKVNKTCLECSYYFFIEKRLASVCINPDSDFFDCECDSENICEYFYGDWI